MQIESNSFDQIYTPIDSVKAARVYLQAGFIVFEEIFEGDLCPILGVESL